MNDRPAAIVLAHGTLADGLVNAVDTISGRGGRLMAISNEGLSATDLAARLVAALDATGAHVIFTDLPAGSCNSAAMRAIHGRDGAVVVMGANLPALLHFAMHDELPPEAAAREAATRGLAVLKAYPGAPSAD